MNEMIKDFKQLKQSKPAVVHAAAIKVSNQVIRRVMRKYDLDPNRMMTKYLGANVDKNVPGFMEMTFNVAKAVWEEGFVYEEETVYFTMEDYRDYSNAAMLLQNAEEEVCNG